MKRVLTLLIILAASQFARATVTVNATLTTPTGPANFAFLQFDLKNCGYNIPVVPNVPSAMVVKSIRFTPAQLPAAIYGDDEITCGNIHSTLWHVTAYADANTPIAGDYDYAICSGTSVAYCPNPASTSWNLATAQPFSGNPPAPGWNNLYGNPTQNQNWNQPAGTQANMNGEFLFSDGIFAGTVTFSQLSSLTGMSNFVYVSDASPSSSPCTGGGTGAFAFYVNGAWTCAIGSNSGPGGGTVTTVSGTANQLQVSNGSTTPVISIVPNPTLPGNVTVTGTFNVSGASFSVFAQTFTGTVGNTGIWPQRGAVSGTAISCFDASGNITNVGCPPISPTAPGVATEVPFRNSGTGLLAADSSLFYNLLSHTLTVTNVNVNGMMTWLNAFGVSSTIPVTPACIPAAGMAVLGVNTDGNFATSNNGSPCVDINSSAIPTGVVKGSELVSSGAAANPVYQGKPMLDVRDIPGVDCTGAADSAAALTAFTGNQPGTNNSITGRTLSFGGCPAIKLATKWLIYNQAGFIISGLTRSGAASKGTQFTWSGGSGAMIEMEYVDGFTVEGLNINGGSAATVGILIDKNGAGGVWNTTDGILRNNTYAGANQNWIGVSISPVSVVNVEDIRVVDSAFYCNATVATTAAVGIQVGASPNAKNEVFSHNNITQCFYGIYLKNGSMIVRDGEFTSNGGTCATGSGADIRIDTNTDVVIIENMLNENSVQGLNVNGDVSAGGPSHPIIIRGNHNAPAGCDNTAKYWYNTPSASIYMFEGDSWDSDSSLVKLIGTANIGNSATIYTRGLRFPNTIFNPWWTNFEVTEADDLKIIDDRLITSLVYSGSANNTASAFMDFRGYLATGAGSPDDFLLQNVPAGGNGSSGSTFLIDHQQGSTGTSMFGWSGSYPGVTIAAISTPALLSVTQSGAAGSTSYTYAVVAYGPAGNTPGSATVNTATGNATLNSTNFNVIRWYPVAGAVKYCLWRTVAAGTPSSIGNIGCTSAAQLKGNLPAPTFSYTANNDSLHGYYFFNDTGLAGDSASLPASNTTGGLSVAGPLTITSTTRVSNLHTSGNPDLISCGGTTTCSNTRQVNGYTVYGSATLAAGTLAYAGLPFASTTWLCNTWDITTPGTTSSMVQVTDATHATITGTGTDVIGFHCDGN